MKVLDEKRLDVFALAQIEHLCRQTPHEVQMSRAAYDRCSSLAQNVLKRLRPPVVVYPRGVYADPTSSDAVEFYNWDPTPDECRELKASGALDYVCALGSMRTRCVRASGAWRKMSVRVWLPDDWAELSSVPRVSVAVASSPFPWLKHHIVLAFERAEQSDRVRVSVQREREDTAIATLASVDGAPYLDAEWPLSTFVGRRGALLALQVVPTDVYPDQEFDRDDDNDEEDPVRCRLKHEHSDWEPLYLDVTSAHVGQRIQLSEARTLGDQQGTLEICDDHVRLQAHIGYDFNWCAAWVEVSTPTWTAPWRSAIAVDPRTHKYDGAHCVTDEWRTSSGFTPMMVSVHRIVSS